MYLLFLLLSSLIIFIFLFFWMKWKYSYWNNLKVKTLYPKFFYGNYEDLIFGRCTEADIIDQAYHQLDKTKYGGIYFFWKPLLIVKDPELINRILVKDFASFPNHPPITDLNGTDTVLKSMFFENDNQWKINRSSLSNLFSHGKIQKMKPKVQQICDKFVSDLEVSSNQGEDVNIHNFIICLSTNLIFSVLYGLKVDKISEFIKAAENFTYPGIATFLRSVLFRILPSVHRTTVKATFNKKLWEFYNQFVEEVMRSGIIDSPNANDLFSYLLKCKKGEIKGREDITQEEMVGHIFSFYNAGHDTLTNVTSLVLFELSRNPDIQWRLRREIEETLNTNNGDCLYDDSLKSNTLITCVIKETLRMYPPFGVIKRVSKENYKIDETLTIPKDMEVMIPCRAIHYDGHYFENPNVFNPDRFMDCTSPMWMPFGIGPRQCLGINLAIMKMKIIISTILTSFELLPSTKMERAIKFNPHTVLLSNRPLQGIWVRVRRLSKGMDTHIQHCNFEDIPINSKD